MWQSIWENLSGALRGLHDWVAQFDPVDVFAVVVFGLFWIWIWRTSRAKNNTFAVVDLLSDPYTGKAAAAPTVYLFLAGLSAWLIVRTAIHGGDPTNALLATLSAFIAKGVFDRAIGAWGPRVAPEAQPPIEDPPKTTPADTDVPDDPCKLPKGLK